MVSSKTLTLDKGKFKKGKIHNNDLNVVRDFWDTFVYDDVTAAKNIPGTIEFFQELENYRYKRLEYLPRNIKFSKYKGKKVLEIGCRIGMDLARFAQEGAKVTGIELSNSCIETARKYFTMKNLSGKFLEMNGEDLKFEKQSFDLVYAHGVIQYTPDSRRMAKEIHRVLKDGGETILMAYNQFSWLTLLSKFSAKGLTHEEAPFFEPYSISQFYHLLNQFSKVEISTERFPAKTKLHQGFIAKLYYTLFVGIFDLLPKSWIKPYGAHLLANARR